MRIFVFDRNNPHAVSAVQKLTSKAVTSGMFLPLTEDEFVAMTGEGVLAVDLDDPPTPKGEADGSTQEPDPLGSD